MGRGEIQENSIRVGISDRSSGRESVSEDGKAHVPREEPSRFGKVARNNEDTQTCLGMRDRTEK